MFTLRSVDILFNAGSADCYDWTYAQTDLCFAGPSYYLLNFVTWSLKR